MDWTLRSDIAKTVDLLLATIEGFRQELLERFEAETANSSLPGFRAQFQHAADNSTFYEGIFNHVQGRQQIRSVMINAVQSHLKEIAPDSPMPIDLVANYLVGAVLQLLDWWLANDLIYSVEEMEKIFLKLIRQGLPTALDTNQDLVTT